MSITAPWGWEVWGDHGLRDRVDGTFDTQSSLALARSLSDVGAAMGTSSWNALSTMATLGSINLSVARVIEPHIDARAILHQARAVATSILTVEDHQTWGVYAAHSPAARVNAVPGTTDPSGRWTLSGTKHWCSLADRVSHALLTATAPDGHHQLFALDLASDGVSVEMSQWKALGLRDITTGTVHLDHACAYPVGEPGWYLDRPGFAWGGIAVAAIWFGAAAALASQLWAAASRRTPDQIALMHVGSCDIALETALLCLRAAAVTMDDPKTTMTEAEVVATRTRAIVAHVAEQVMSTVGHALGPAPLAFDRAHATRVADLTLYLRQHHAERDLAHLGTLVLGSAEGGSL